MVLVFDGVVKEGSIWFGTVWYGGLAISYIVRWQVGKEKCAV